MAGSKNVGYGRLKVYSSLLRYSVFCSNQQRSSLSVVVAETDKEVNLGRGEKKVRSLAEESIFGAEMNR